MMKQHFSNGMNNFIAGWYMDDTSLCDDIVSYHKKNDDKFVGLIGRGGNLVIDFEMKDSIDCHLFNYELEIEYTKHLQSCVEQYLKIYPESGQTDNLWSSGVESKNVQFYKPNGGYKKWHFERRGIDSNRRHLVFMTYLNTIKDGGGTSFKYQNLDVNAEKGLTLIWPSDWTHTHRGIVSPTEEKYIITGWFCFV